MNFVEELTWRGMIHDIMPGTEDCMDRELVSAYVGIDPTADSLHIGHLVGVMMLKHLQHAGHRPIALVGGATGMIGDPSGKSQERNLLDEETLRHNQDCLKAQIGKFLDFETDVPNRALMVNNYDWMKEYSFLGFIRDIGKHITVNYMMAKDSVKKRVTSESATGMSFTEFTYQLVQGFDFLHLYREYNCKLQMGGSDQWGNITTGTELIRRKEGGEAFALTCPLITKSDGGKFGKTEEGNVWLDPARTSPYKFYQFWLNVSDEDAEKYIKIFTMLTREEVEVLVSEHREAPHQRVLQKRLAEEVTAMVHSGEDLDMAIEASQILFGNATEETLSRIPEEMFLSVFEGVPHFSIPAEKKNADIMTLLTEEAPVFPSRGELRRLVQGGGLSINKQKVADPDHQVVSGDYINGRYLLVQKGKRNYFLITVNSN
ncbi:MAG: tyrosine--tRNA ligase [Bacteroidales bacterium]|nr:tyrosine--tRNA ligase [Bacteroidales bacterium]MDT8432246.1 tyrosine--tRNA ligase [Bacteroidales bacterium]